jgi:hypothetical protein
MGFALGVILTVLMYEYRSHPNAGLSRTDGISAPAKSIGDQGSLSVGGNKIGDPT